MTQRRAVCVLPLGSAVFMMQSLPFWGPAGNYFKYKKEEGSRNEDTLPVREDDTIGEDGRESYLGALVVSKTCDTSSPTSTGLCQPCKPGAEGVICRVEEQMLSRQGQPVKTGWVRLWVTLGSCLLGSGLGYIYIWTSASFGHAGLQHLTQKLKIWFCPCLLFLVPCRLL